MEVESFENDEIAKILNDWFVSIKVLLLILKCYNFVFISVPLHVFAVQKLCICICKCNVAVFQKESM